MQWKFSFRFRDSDQEYTAKIVYLHDKDRNYYLHETLCEWIIIKDRNMIGRAKVVADTKRDENYLICDSNTGELVGTALDRLEEICDGIWEKCNWNVHYTEEDEEKMFEDDIYT